MVGAVVDVAVDGAAFSVVVAVARAFLLTVMLLVFVLMLLL